MEKDRVYWLIKQGSAYYLRYHKPTKTRDFWTGVWKWKTQGYLYTFCSRSFERVMPGLKVTKANPRLVRFSQTKHGMCMEFAD